jgi:tetratricopeptide (TPR) repeat protein
MRTLTFLTYLVAISTALLYPQATDTPSPRSAFSLELDSGLQIPIGRDSDIFTLGPDFDLSAQYSLKLLPRLSLDLIGDVGYILAPIRIDNSVSIVRFGVGIGLGFDLLDRLIFQIHGNGGYFYGFLNRPGQVELGSDEKASGGNPFVAAGLRATYLLSPTIGLGVNAGYTNHLGFKNGLIFSFVTSLYPKRRNQGDVLKEEIQLLREEIKDQISDEITEPELELTAVELDPVFPVFYSYYSNHPLGKLTLHNQADETIKNIKVSFFVKRYMDDPMVFPISDSIEAGRQITVDVFGLLTDSVLEVTEGTKVSANFTVDYQIGDVTRKREYIDTLRIHNRNAITWDDDRKVAAFVTSKDPMVQKFAKNIIGMIRGSRSSTVIENLHTAMVLYTALTVFGLDYQIDPMTPYQEYSVRKAVLDYLQFPNQTLGYKAGDCDDLSILYNALLEALGIETAFITTPGHIFTAFSLDMNHSETWKIFRNPDDLIFQANKIWLPVEITQIGDGFLNAWSVGSREWREHSPAGRAGFYPTREAWVVFEPVGFVSADTDLSLPAEQVVVDAYQEQMNKFLEKEIGERVARLEEELEKGGEDARKRNALGVLFARYGLEREAEAEFNKAVELRDYLPALFNLGNIYFLRGDMDQALKYFEKAAALSPDNPKILLGIARILHAQENFGSARRIYERVSALDPELASRFAYLDLRGEQAVRAANMEKNMRLVIWLEE